MDVAHAILFAKTIDISRVTADCLSAKFELKDLTNAQLSYKYASRLHQRCDRLKG